MKVSLVGLLRNAADELDALSRIREEDEDFDGVDYSAMYAFSLREAAGHIDMLENDPALLTQWLDLYCLKNTLASLKTEAV